jgi:type IV pilus assembly protein PilY1
MKSFKQIPLIFLLSGLLGFAMPGLADDTDIFLSNPAITGTRPNVLIILDNAAANNSEITNPCSETQKKLEMEQCVLQEIINDASVVNDELNIGLMIYNPSSKVGSDKGGYVRYHVRQMTDGTGGTPNNKADLAAKIASITTSNNALYAKSMHEAYLYYGGKAPYVGVASKEYDPAAYDLSTNTYNSPATDGCQKNYILYIGNGGPDSGENNDAEALLKGIGGRLPSDPIGLDPDNFQTSWLDEYARTLKGQDVVPHLSGSQNVITYTIAVHNPADKNDDTKPMKAVRALLKSAGLRGGGKYFDATNTDKFKEALKAVFNEIQAVDSVFASVTLPVSVNVRGTNLNQVYMGVFRPDENLMPRWLGNLKEYKLAYDKATDTLYLVDSQGLAIENTLTGFVVDPAVSFWTEASTYWGVKYPAKPSDKPDGPLVEKGGAAQRLRTSYATDQSARKLYTCIDCTAGSALSSAPFAESNATITPDMLLGLGATDTTESAAIINWVRGQNNKKEDENTNSSTTDVRPSIHGDVLHSRPVVVNYNRDGTNNDIMVYYGANDGIFHAVKGGQGSCAAPGSCDGEEKWGFVAQEFFGQFKRLREQTPLICSNDPSSTNACITEPDSKPYFFDGSVGVYQEDVDKNGKYIAADGNKVYIYLTMRRGGRAIYALDVSDPADPRFLWKKSYLDFPELGQTWSYPKPAKIEIKDSNEPAKKVSKAVVIFGAGYDPNQDDLTPPVADTMGRGIFVVDAFDGTVIWQAGPSPSGDAIYNKTVSDMLYSIPADVTVINSDVDSYDDRMYVGDTGGNVWRVDIADSDPDEWTVNKLAAVGNTRKFLHAPDAVPGEDGSGIYDAVLIGSGDREHPFDTTVTNRFYMLKDRPIFEGATISESDLVDQTTSQNPVPVGKKGWFITLGSGEKTVGGNAVTLAGTTFFVTNQPAPPAPGTCASNLGIARLYQIHYEDAAAVNDVVADGNLNLEDRAEILAGGGFQPPPTPVAVDIDGTIREGVVVGVHTEQVPSAATGQRSRIFWYQEIE